MAIDRETIAEIEAVLLEHVHVRLTEPRPGHFHSEVEMADAVAAIAALCARGAASEAQEDQAFAVAYTDARGRMDYEHMARVLSGRLRRMDRRSAAANQRADRLEAELAALRSKDREDGAREMRERFKAICAEKIALGDRALASQEGAPFPDGSYCAAVGMTQDVLRDIIQQIEPEEPTRQGAEVIPLCTRKGGGNA